MEIWLKGLNGQIIGVYRNGKLTMSTPLGSDGVRMMGYEVFTLLHALLNIGGGASYGGQMTGSDDSDFGSPGSP